MPWRKRLFWFGVGLLIAIVLTIYSVFNTTSRAIEHQTASIGESIYEYHRKTGQWPKEVDDLAKTSLAPHYIEAIKRQYSTVVWHQDLKPDPKDNAERILVYHNGGWLPQLWGVCTCWGDLRIDYESRSEVEAKVRAGKN